MEMRVKEKRDDDERKGEEVKGEENGIVRRKRRREKIRGKTNSNGPMFGEKEKDRKMRIELEW